ncbi:anti-sigma factor family protein [Corynebacterium uropygiale]|uniref:anti-sigma factor family protein n=1 Tax=Corynebacterium uropygiale TaxID=1775911 RepID=UPI0030843BDF
MEHLGPEAIAAYVDGEMGPTARRRAHHHLCECEECRNEVDRHRMTAARVRSCRGDDVPMPEDLLARLQGIAVDCHPGPEAEDTPHCKPGWRERIDQALHGDVSWLSRDPQRVSGMRGH